MTRCSHAHRAAGKRSVGCDVELAGRRYDGFVRRLEFEVGRAQAQDCACTGLILGASQLWVLSVQWGWGRVACPALREGQAWRPECAAGENTYPCSLSGGFQ